MKICRTKNSNTPSLLLALAALLIVLGTGNSMYGASKAANYLLVVQNIERELARPHKPVFPLIDPALAIDREQQHLRRVRGSYHFYIFVRRAGIAMIALGLVCILPGLCILPGKRREQESPSEAL